MTLLQLEIFVVIVDTGSFTKTGEMLNITQSGISQAIANLEIELSLKLLHRGRNGVTLTEAGEKIIQHAREVLHQQEKIKEISAAILGYEIGTIKIGSFPSFMASKMPLIIKKFTNLYPNIKLVLQEGDYEEIIDRVTNGVIDIGFTVYPVGDLPFVPLIKDAMLLIMPENHPLRTKQAHSIEDFLSDPFIKDMGCDRFLHDIFKDIKETPTFHFEIRDTNTILSMVRSGLGVAILPEMSIPDSVSGISTAKIEPEIHRNIGMCYSSQRQLSPSASLFVNFIKSLEL